jgi:alpha-galactosidase
MVPLVLSVSRCSGLDNGMALTPPLAYSTWNMFNDDTNDTLIRELGDALESTGLAALGYRTLNIDAGYLIHERHPVTQRLQVNATKFPHGMRPLADYLEAKGIGLGVYTDHGNGSCGNGPGSFGECRLRCSCCVPCTAANRHYQQATTTSMPRPFRIGTSPTSR